MRFLEVACVRAAALIVVAASAVSTHPVLATGTSSASPDVPDVLVGYSNLLDDACAVQSGRELDSVLVAGVRSRIPEYNAQWAARGPALLRMARGLVGQPYQFSETRAAVVTCGIPSMSFPLVLNARSFWRSGTDSLAEQSTVFVNTLFHELLHRYVSERVRQLPGGTTVLLSKYAGESVVIRNHLHVFAIEQAVYDRLGLENELVLAKSMQRSLRSAQAFARAREIVATEGVEAFLRELGPTSTGAAPQR